MTESGIDVTEAGRRIASFNFAMEDTMHLSFEELVRSVA